MVGFAIFSFFISHLLLKYTPDPFNKLVKSMAILGIIIHELCHIVMCLLTNTHIEKIRLLAKDENKEMRGKFDYFGNITVKGGNRLTFLQALLISLAPLMFSFWLFFYLWDLIFNPELNMMLFFLYLFVMISIVLAAAPSFADLISIPKAIQQDPHYSLYQAILLSLSIIAVWILALVFQLSFVHEFITYILIMIFYYAFKYSFRGINELFQTLRLRNVNLLSNQIPYGLFTRRRFKPTKPKKLGIEEAHW
jgi:hypothetical protein